MENNLLVSAPQNIRKTCIVNIKYILIVTTQDCDDITCHQTKVKFRGLTLLGNYWNNFLLLQDFCLKNCSFPCPLLKEKYKYKATGKTMRLPKILKEKKNKLMEKPCVN